MPSLIAVSNWRVADISTRRKSSSFRPSRRHNDSASYVLCKVNTDQREDRNSTGEKTRRAVLLGALPIGVGACVEVLSRPPIVKPFKTRKEIQIRKEKAAILLEKADEAMGVKNYTAAVDLYTGVIELAPRNYVLCMKALLGRRDAYLELGLNRKSSSDARREFGWGRGIRWPGWYIMTAIVIRNEFMCDK